MKIFLASILFCVGFVCQADQIVDYTLSVQNAPGGIGDFSWTVEHDGFIENTPDTFDAQGNCTNCDRYIFKSFIALSAPSNGEGCGIYQVQIDPGSEFDTYFSPLCDGKYDATLAGDIQVADTLGTWQWQGTNPDNTTNYVTVTISDPPADPVSTPEPSTVELLLCALGLLWLAVTYREVGAWPPE